VIRPMSTIMPHRCPCGCGKFDHNAFRPVANCAFSPPPRPTGSRRAQTPPSADTLAAHRDLDDSPMVTISQFQALARTRGWSEDWLVEQCRDGMDNPRQIIKEILDGHGLTKPWFTSETSKPSPVNMADTVLVWTLLLDLYLTYSGQCVECDGELKSVEASYCSPRCRKRASRRNPKRSRHVPEMAI
jgi:hypothetical protein